VVVATADGNVEIGVLVVDDGVGRGQPQLYLGVAALELRQPGQQPVHGQRGGGVDAQQPGLLACEFFGGIGNAVKRGLHHRQVLPSGVGQPQAAAQPLEQRHAQPFFQQRYLAADGAVGDVQLLGGGGQALVAGGHFKGAQRVKRR